MSSFMDFLWLFSRPFHGAQARGRQRSPTLLGGSEMARECRGGAVSGVDCRVLISWPLGHATVAEGAPGGAISP